MKQPKDIRFYLVTMKNRQEQTKTDFQSFQWEIERNGYFLANIDGKTVKIYTAELAYILTSKELPAVNMDTSKPKKINGLDYLKTYVNGFLEGEEYFEKNFKVSPNTLYGANTEQYIRDIHINYFHTEHTTLNKGWVIVKKQYPNILTHRKIRELGYYSGIVAKVDEEISKHPKPFASFHICEHNLPNEKTENQADKLKVNQIALIHVYQGLQITRENAGKIAAKYGYTSKNSGEGLFQDYTTYCSTANRKGKPISCTPKKLKNKIELFESVVCHLSDNNKQRAIDEIQILKTIFENEYQ